MQPSRGQRDITSEIEKFWKLAEICGFTIFVYDPSKRRVKLVKCRLKCLRIMLVALESAACLTVSIIVGMSFYAEVILLDYTSWQNSSSIQMQETFLVVSSFLTQYFCFGLLARSLLRAHHQIVPVINEMLKIFDALRKRTDSTLSVPRIHKYAVDVRILNLMYTFSVGLAFYMALCVALIGFINIYGSFLTAAVLIGHLYSQLVLIGFYSKMADFLRGAGSSMNKKRLSKEVQVLLKLSFRMHRVKAELNRLSSGLYLTVFFGLSLSICIAYNAWKQVVFDTEWAESMPRLISGCCWLFANFFLIIYDLYLICWFSDELVARERRFMRSLLVLICRNELSNRVQASWEIHQIMIRSEVFKLNSVLLGMVDLDKPFVLSYFFYTVCQYIVMCMQFYMRERYRKTR